MREGDHSSANPHEPLSLRCREERSSSSEGQIRFLVYTLEIASHRADSLGEELTSALVMASSTCIAIWFQQYSAALTLFLIELYGGSPAPATLLAGKGKLTWLIDMAGYSMRNAPSLRVSKAT